MYIKIENDVPVDSPIDQWDLFKLFPNTSFVIPIVPEDLIPFGYGVIQSTLKPRPGKYENVASDGYQKDELTGYWLEVWKTVEMTQEEKDVVDAEKAQAVRDERNKKLLDCDWTQLQDSPVDKTAWSTYRQELRDVTTQPGFPWTVVWPLQPT